MLPSSSPNVEPSNPRQSRIKSVIFNLGYRSVTSVQIQLKHSLAIHIQAWSNMSADSVPINPARFAAALKDLNVGSLHAKAAELQNSINHLRSSNSELEDYLRAQPADQRADPDLVDAIQENVEVMERMQSRIRMIKEEVEQRGMPWPSDHEDSTKDDANGEDVTMENGFGDSAGNQHTNGAPAGTTDEEERGQAVRRSGQETQQSGRFTDEELARRLRERMGDNEDDEEGGLHL